MMKQPKRKSGRLALATVMLSLFVPMLALSAFASTGVRSAGVGLRLCVLALTLIAVAGLTLMVVISYRRFRRREH